MNNNTKTIIRNPSIEILNNIHTVEHLKVTYLPDGRRAVSFDEWIRCEREVHDKIMRDNSKHKRRLYERVMKARQRAKGSSHE